MKVLRSFVIFLIMGAYALWLMHSVIPHDHYESFDDFKVAHAHSGHEHEHGHNENDDQDNEEHDGSLLIVTHFANADVSTKTFTLKKAACARIKHISAALVVNPRLLEINFSRTVFHVPIRAPLSDIYLAASRPLRAPPLFSKG